MLDALARSESSANPRYRLDCSDISFERPTPLASLGSKCLMFPIRKDATSALHAVVPHLRGGTSWNVPHRAHARETCVQFGCVQDPERTHRALTHVRSHGITRLPDKRDKRHDHDSIGDQTRSRHCAHYTVHFRLCGGRAAHFCTLSTFRGQGSCHQCSSMQHTFASFPVLCMSVGP